MFSTQRRTTGRARRNRLARKNHRNLHRHRPLRHEPLEDRTLLSVGSWVGPGATDELLQTFHNPNPEAGDGFGVAVDVVGNDMILVGAPYDDTGAEDAGRAYLFDRTTGELRYSLHNPAPDADDYFGRRAVAVGDQHMLIAAPRADAEGYQHAGAVYLFNLDGELIQTIPSPTPGSSNSFGESLAYYKGDDQVGEKVIIGEPWQDTGGVAHVYDFEIDSNTGKVSVTDNMTLENPTPSEGYAVAEKVAAMQDGVVLASRYHDEFLFSWDGQLITTFSDPDADPNTECGYSVATTDDNKVVFGAEEGAHLFEPDGTLLHSWLGPGYSRQVAAVGNNILASDTGEEGAEGVSTVRLYDGSTGKLLQTFTNPTPEDGDRFRAGLATFDNKVLIADYRDNTGAESAGSVYAFELFNTDTTAGTGSLRGHVFADLNGNDGVALPEVFQVYLDANENGLLDEGEMVTTTRDRTGRFAFHNLPIDTYTVAQVSQPGWSLTTDPQTVVVNAGEVTTDVDFANTIANTKMEYFAPDSEVPFRIKNGFTHWSWFSVEESYPILDVDAMLDITHDNLDIGARLRLHEGTDYTAPGGIAAGFWDAHALAGGEQLNGTVFDDEASLFIEEGSSPYDGTTDGSEGRYRPSYSPFTAFDLQDAAGTWELTIGDNGLDKATGWCHNWSVSLTRALPDGTNDAPVVNNDQYSVVQSGVLEADVLTNDSDPDGGAEADRPGLTAVVVDGPSNGSLLLRPAGSFRYIPYHDFAGTDTFTYKVSDVFSYSEEATVTIDVTSEPQPGITLEPVSGLETTEEGGTDSFDVVLDTQPTADVTLGISSNDDTEGTVDETSLTFTSANWDKPQTVTVTGKDDQEQDGDQGYWIITDPATSDDDSYEGLKPADVSVTNLDNEDPPGDASNMYVWDIEFDLDVLGNGKFTNLGVEATIHRDSDADGNSEWGEAPVEGATVTVVLSDPAGGTHTYTGVTDSYGVFATDKIKKAADGTYVAEVTNVELADHAWDPNDVLDPTTNDNDADDDGKPDDQYVLGSATSSSSTTSLSTSSVDGTESGPLLATTDSQQQDQVEPVTATSTTEPALSSNSEPEGGTAADALLPPRQLAEPSLDLLAADRRALSANRERGDHLTTDQALDELLAGMEDPDPLDDMVLALA